MDLKLTQLNIQGFKSFGREQNIRFGDVTIFIGANGSGKSNLMSFFEMLDYMMNKGLAVYIAKNGGAKFFTHLDSSQSINCKLDLELNTTKNIYSFRLAPTNSNDFVFTGEEIIKVYPTEDYTEPERLSREINKIGKESGLPDFAEKDDTGIYFIKEMFAFFRKSKLFKFYDTSSSAAIRKVSYRNNTGYLMSNGGNLAAFLYGLQQRPEFKKYYERVIRNIQLAYPSFEDFILSPNQFYPDNILLDWKDESSPPDFRFSPQQLSDGTLRFMALTALLLQPPETIPKVIVIDEPELGLHPSAISLLANMIYTAAPYSQIVLATQSAELLDYFEPEHIRVVEREGSNSIVTEPDEEGLKSWLEEYSLGQIWEKNIIGGRP